MSGAPHVNLMILNREKNEMMFGLHEKQLFTYVFSKGDRKRSLRKTQGKVVEY
jgi:hypothetical protein